MTHHSKTLEDFGGPTADEDREFLRGLNETLRDDEQDALMGGQDDKEDMGTNFVPTGTLKAKGRALLVAAYDFWKEHQKVCGAWAVVWISDHAGKLVVFTRSEYLGDIMRNIQPLYGETPLGDDPEPDEQDPLTRARALLREATRALKQAHTITTGGAPLAEKGEACRWWNTLVSRIDKLLAGEETWPEKE